MSDPHSYVNCNLETPLFDAFDGGDGSGNRSSRSIMDDASIIFSLSCARKSIYTHFTFFKTENFSNNTIGLLWCYSANDTLTWLMLFVNLISNKIRQTAFADLLFFSLSFSLPAILFNLLASTSFSTFGSTVKKKNTNLQKWWYIITIRFVRSTKYALLSIFLNLLA